jgi:glutamine cyclotransferase
MKVSRIASIFLLSAICCAQVACKKDDDKPSQQTPTQILLSHSWKKTGYKENGVSQTIAACELDDVLTFSSNNTQTVDRGTVKCGGETQTFTDGWSLSADNKTIIILSVVGTGELVSIDDNQFVVRRSGATTFEYIYSKK